MAESSESPVMQINPDLTLRQVQERLDRVGGKVHLHLHFEHGVYHAYVHGESQLKSYGRGDLTEAIDGATQSA